MYYYVSHVTEYPIYEPAEGGYYYAGTTTESSRRFPTWKKANKFFQKAKKQFLEDHPWEVEQGRVHVWEESGVCKDNEGSCVRYHSRYIGEGEFVILTRGEYVENGWEPYC